MQSMLQNRIRELAKAAEMTAEPKPKTPDAYWDHVNKVAPLKKKTKVPTKRCTTGQL